MICYDITMVIVYVANLNLLMLGLEIYMMNLNQLV